MHELLAILALSAASPSVGAAPTVPALPVPMSREMWASDAFGGDAVILARGGGMGGGARPQGGMNGGGGGMNCGAHCGGGGMGGTGSGGGMGGTGSGGGMGGSGGTGGSGGGTGGLLQLLGVPQEKCPDHRRKGQTAECRDDE